MARRFILKIGDEALRKKCKEVTEFDGRLADLLNDLKETMYAANGVGLAANQVGILKRAAVVDVGPTDKPQLVELINPIITYSEGEQCDNEGCLSIPGEQSIVKRPNIVVVKTRSRTGKTLEIRGEGFFARALCHEIDHLDGILYIDRAEKPSDRNNNL
jgi:peptide deformylase